VDGQALNMAWLILFFLLFSLFGFSVSPWLGLALFGTGFALACTWVVWLFARILLAPAHRRRS
jgi:hypothetical protein